MKKILSVIVLCVACMMGAVAFHFSYVPELTYEKAKELVQKQEELLCELYSQGFTWQELTDAYEWYADDDNKVSEISETHKVYKAIGACHSVYCIEKFDTEQKFDDYFTDFFTESALAKMKTELEISVKDGKLCGVPVKYESENKYPEEMRILSVVKNGKNAFVTVEFVTGKTLAEEYTEDVYKSMQEVRNSDLMRKSFDQPVYTFEYSHKHGWRSTYDTFGKACKTTSIDEAYEKNLVLGSEKAPTLVRPDGYDNPMLTYDTALEILNEERHTMIGVIMYAGTCGKSSDEYYSYYNQWAYKFDNQALPTYDEENGFDGAFRLNFVPWLDTMEEFDNYFLQVFTEETLEIIKGELGVSESEGKLAIVPRHRLAVGSALVDYDLTTIDSIEYDEKNKTAIVNLIVFDIEGNRPQVFPKTLVYSEQYGWRVQQDSAYVV